MYFIDSCERASSQDLFLEIDMFKYLITVKYFCLPDGESFFLTELDARMN